MYWSPFILKYRFMSYQKNVVVTLNEYFLKIGNTDLDEILVKCSLLGIKEKHMYWSQLPKNTVFYRENRLPPKIHNSSKSAIPILIKLGSCVPLRAQTICIDRILSKHTL